MIYAPVTIPTLCRAEHFMRCIESLKRNTWARFTEVYIGLDYPAKESHWDGYRRILTYLEAPMPEFKAVHIFRWEQNIGSSRNSGRLREACAKRFDRFIYVEDDLEVSPNYLQYMDIALEAYKDDPTVIGIAGYAYSLNWVARPGCTVVRQNFAASAWGRGLWIDKRNQLYSFLKWNGLSKSFASAYRAGKFDRMIDFAVKDYVTLSRNGWGGKRAFLNSTTDIALRIYLAVKDKYIIMPLVSKVRNHGYDGSGQNCQKLTGDGTDEFCVDNYDFAAQPIDTDTDFVLKEDRDFPMEQNRQLLNRFDKVPSETMDCIWEEAKRIAAGGRYYGLFRRIRVSISRFLSFVKKKRNHSGL